MLDPPAIPARGGGRVFIASTPPGMLEGSPPPYVDVIFGDNIFYGKK